MTDEQPPPHSPEHTLRYVIDMLGLVESSVGGVQALMGSYVSLFVDMQAGRRPRGVELSEKRQATVQARGQLSTLLALLAKHRASAEAALASITGEQPSDG